MDKKLLKMDEKLLKVEDLYKFVKDNLNKEIINIKNNYQEIYKAYSEDGLNELRRDNKIEELNHDLKNLESQIEEKNDFIYIYFKYLNLIDYNEEDLLNHKFEITEDNYDYFLEVLPPLKMSSNYFLMSEFLIGDITHRYFIKDNKYFIDGVKVDRGKLEKIYWGDY
jgi:hypothetical protein